MIRGVNFRSSSNTNISMSFGKGARSSLAPLNPNLTKTSLFSFQKGTRLYTKPASSSSFIATKNTKVPSFKTTTTAPATVGAGVVQRLFAQQPQNPSSKHSSLWNSYKKSAQQQQQQPPQDPNQYYPPPQQQQQQQPHQPYQQTPYQDPYQQQQTQYPPAPYQQQQPPYQGQPTYAYQPEEPPVNYRTDLPDEVWNVQLQRYLKRVMASVATGLGITAATTIVASSYAAMFMGWTFAIPAIIVSIGAIMGVTMTRPTFRQQEMEHQGQRYMEVISENPPMRNLAALVLYVALGLSITPLVTISWMSNPSLVIGAAAATAAVMGGMITYALRKPVGSFQKWEGPLTIALFGLIGVSLMAVFLKSSMLSLACCAGGVAIFTMLTATDTHKAIESFHSGEPDHLRDSVSFYLNAVNLFTDILRLLRAFSGSD